MLVVDTSVWIDYFNSVENPRTDYLHVILDATPALVFVSIRNESQSR